MCTHCYLLSRHLIWGLPPSRLAEITRKRVRLCGSDEVRVDSSGVPLISQEVASLMLDGLRQGCVRVVEGDAYHNMTL